MLAKFFHSFNSAEYGLCISPINVVLDLKDLKVDMQLTSTILFLFFLIHGQLWGLVLETLPNSIDIQFQDTCVFGVSEIKESSPLNDTNIRQLSAHFN